jgi:hypothetical protein
VPFRHRWAPKGPYLALGEPRRSWRRLLRWPSGRTSATDAVLGVPLLQCGGRTSRALSGSAGPVGAWFVLLLHPVGYRLRAVEAVPSRVPPYSCSSPVFRQLDLPASFRGPR